MPNFSKTYHWLATLAFILPTVICNDSFIAWSKPVPNYQIGTTIKIPNKELRVVGFKLLGKTINSSSYGKLSAFGNWVTVAIDLKNTSNRTASFSSSQFEIVDTKGKVYAADFKGNFYSTDRASHFLDGTQLPPNTKARFYLLFDVTPGAKIVKLVFQQEPYNNPNKKISINIGS
ncbi:MAG: DUF4352 domain-containing protein [Crinalium sp.]